MKVKENEDYTIYVGKMMIYSRENRQGRYHKIGREIEPGTYKTQLSTYENNKEMARRYK